MLTQEEQFPVVTNIHCYYSQSQHVITMNLHCQSIQRELILIPTAIPNIVTGHYRKNHKVRGSSFLARNRMHTISELSKLRELWVVGDDSIWCHHSISHWDQQPITRYTNTCNTQQTSSSADSYAQFSWLLQQHSLVCCIIYDTSKRLAVHFL